MSVDTDRADIVEALRHAACCPLRDWSWIDRLLDDLLEVRGR